MRIVCSTPSCRYRYAQTENRNGPIDLRRLGRSLVQLTYLAEPVTVFRQRAFDPLQHPNAINVPTARFLSTSTSGTAELTYRVLHAGRCLSRAARSIPFRVPAAVHWRDRPRLDLEFPRKSAAAVRPRCDESSGNTGCRCRSWRTA